MFVSPTRILHRYRADDRIESLSSSRPSTLRKFLKVLQLRLAVAKTVLADRRPKECGPVMLRTQWLWRWRPERATSYWRLDREAVFKTPGQRRYLIRRRLAL